LGDLRNAYNYCEETSDYDQGRHEKPLRKYLYERSWEILTLLTYLKMDGRLDYQNLFETLNAR
jgi:hypothetical protein